MLMSSRTSRKACSPERASAASPLSASRTVHPQRLSNVLASRRLGLVVDDQGQAWVGGHLDSGRQGKTVKVEPTPTSEVSDAAAHMVDELLDQCKPKPGAAMFAGQEVFRVV